MKTIDEILYYLSKEQGQMMKEGEKSIVANALQVMLDKLEDGEEVLLPIMVSFVRHLEQKGFIRTPLIVVTSRKRILYSGTVEPYVLTDDCEVSKTMANETATRVQIGKLQMEIATPTAQVMLDKLNECFLFWQSANVVSFEEKVAKQREERYVEQQAQMLEKHARLQREYELRTQKEIEQRELAAIQKAQRLSRKFEYKVLSQDDAWFSAHLDKNRLEQALNHYAAEGWRVVGCVSGDTYGIVVGQKNQTIIILEREI